MWSIVEAVLTATRVGLPDVWDGWDIWYTLGRMSNEAAGSFRIGECPDRSLS